MYSRSSVRGDSARTPDCAIQSCTPWPMPMIARDPNMRCSVAISMAASATFRNGTGSTPTPTATRCVAPSTAAAEEMPPGEEGVLPQPELVEPESSAARAIDSSCSGGL